MSTRPAAVPNEANATIRVLVCDNDAAGGVVLGQPGAAATNCRRQLNVRGTRLTRDNVSRRLVVEVRATRPGQVSIEGADVLYRDGWHVGRQHSGLKSTITFT